MNEKLLLIPIFYLWVLNVTAFGVYAYDKVCALRGRWRVPEKVLITFAFAGGALGALAGMFVFRHKIRKWKFRILVPLALILWVALCVWLGLWLLK